MNRAYLEDSVRSQITPPTNLFHPKFQPRLRTIEDRLALPPRPYPYWNALHTNRHLGFYRTPTFGTCWIARYGIKGGGYKQSRIGETDEKSAADNHNYLTYEQAVVRAENVFKRNAQRLRDPSPVREKCFTMRYTPTGNVQTLGHALDDYLKLKKITGSESTHYGLVGVVNRYLALNLGPIPLDELRSEHFLDCFQNVLETAPHRGHRVTHERMPIASLDKDILRRRRKTVNTLVMILKETLQLAWQNGKTENYRLWRSLRRIRNTYRPRMFHLSRAECRRLIKNCQPDFRNLIKGALFSGCRSVELLQMRAQDVGRDGHGVFVPPTKTVNSRFVFLPDEGMVFFLKLVKGKQPNDLIFTRKDGRPWSKAYINPFRRACLAADLPKGFGFHGLRHTYASQLVQAGTPLSVVSEQLGHVTAVTVSRTYGHIAPQIREAEVRQRFAGVQAKKSKFTKTQKKLLADWKRSRGEKRQKSYARIADVQSLKNIF